MCYLFSSRMLFIQILVNIGDVDQRIVYLKKLESRLKEMKRLAKVFLHSSSPLAHLPFLVPIHPSHLLLTLYSLSLPTSPPLHLASPHLALS